MKMKNYFLCVFISYLFFSCSTNKTNKKKLNGKVLEVKEYTFDAETKFDSITFGSLQNTIITKYSNEGNILTISENGGFNIVDTFIYNKDGLKILKLEENDATHGGIDTTIYVYNKQNQIIEESVFSKFFFTEPKSSVFFKYKYIYDNSSNLIETQTIYRQYRDVTDENQKTIYEYDNNNNVISETSYIRNKITSKKTYKYNNNNDVIEEKHFLGNGQLDNLVQYVYTLDDYDNWIIKIEAWNEHPQYYYKREIKYQ